MHISLSSAAHLSCMKFGSALHVSCKVEMVDPKGVEPSSCLLAKQMPLPHSSHGPINHLCYSVKIRFTASNSPQLLNNLEAIAATSHQFLHFAFFAERPAKSLLAQTCCKTALGLISQFIVRQAGQMHAHNMHRRLTTALSLLCAWSTTRYPSATPLLFHCQSLVRCAHATVINYQFSKIYCVAEEELSHSFNIAYCIKSWCFVNQNFLNNFANSILGRSLKDLFNILLT